MLLLLILVKPPGAYRDSHGQKGIQSLRSFAEAKGVPQLRLNRNALEFRDSKGTIQACARIGPIAAKLTISPSLDRFQPILVCISSPDAPKMLRIWAD